MASTGFPELSAKTPTAKLPLLPLLLLCVLTAVVAAAGSSATMLYLAKHGKLLTGSPSNVTVLVEKPAPVATTNVALEPMLVNLADDDAHSYLRLSVVLAEAIDTNEKTKSKQENAGQDNAAVRDVILEILGRKHAAELLAPSGKEQLRTEIAAALKDKLKMQVEAVYFTDFLVQR
ncbi:MAG: flagellar basal body-associated FliL family protein [Acidobacteriaceae bacterium]|nr:flagellar basal body-associated FliL family protein [Acidobacteriaceae bacterium]